MARRLNEKDITLLKKLAPELAEIVCAHAKVPFKSILPPLSNHVARDAADFEGRLRNLQDEELAYLVDMVMEGLESLSCVPPDYAEVFISLVAERISKEAADKITMLYLDMVCE
ncbi:MAG: hypothetical protein EFT35_09880 [Methanophagales archaeon ANME-1-THS]|nr:MAG: hypothetical protein EFT35_09880 [Methanophagales archaeon ANME-1-THS]